MRYGADLRPSAGLPQGVCSRSANRRRILSAWNPITRLNAALKGRYAIERELGEGGSLTKEE